jgi:hypothetical protein
MKSPQKRRLSIMQISGSNMIALFRWKRGFCDLTERYGKNPKASEQMEELRKATVEIENKIFTLLGSDPSELQHLQGEEDLSIGILVSILTELLSRKSSAHSVSAEMAVLVT